MTKSPFNEKHKCFGWKRHNHRSHANPWHQRKKLKTSVTFTNRNTVKPVLSGRSNKTQKYVFKTDNRLAKLMQVKSIYDVALTLKSTIASQYIVLYSEPACKLINRIQGSCPLILSLPCSALRTHVKSLCKALDSTNIFKALPGRLDIISHSTSILY